MRDWDELVGLAGNAMINLVCDEFMSSQLYSRIESFSSRQRVILLLLSISIIEQTIKRNWIDHFLYSQHWNWHCTCLFIYWTIYVSIYYNHNCEPCRYYYYVGIANCSWSIQFVVLVVVVWPITNKQTNISYNQWSWWPRCWSQYSRIHEHINHWICTVLLLDAYVLF